MTQKLVLAASALGGAFWQFALTGPAHATLTGDSVFVGIDVPNLACFTRGDFSEVSADPANLSDVFVLTGGSSRTLPQP